MTALHVVHQQLLDLFAWLSKSKLIAGVHINHLPWLCIGVIMWILPHCWQNNAVSTSLQDSNECCFQLMIAMGAAVQSVIAMDAAAQADLDKTMPNKFSITSLSFSCL